MADARRNSLPADHACQPTMFAQVEIERGSALAFSIVLSEPGFADDHWLPDANSVFDRCLSPLNL